jgi:hypothetical protein
LCKSFSAHQVSGSLPLNFFLPLATTVIADLIRQPQACLRFCPSPPHHAVDRLPPRECLLESPHAEHAKPPSVLSNVSVVSYARQNGVCHQAHPVPSKATPRLPYFKILPFSGSVHHHAYPVLRSLTVPTKATQRLAPKNPRLSPVTPVAQRVPKRPYKRSRTSFCRHSPTNLIGIRQLAL